METDPKNPAEGPRADDAASGIPGGRLLGGMRLLLLFAGHAVGTTNIMGVMAFAPAIQRDLGLTPAGFGLLVAAYYGAQPIVALPGGWLVDRIGVRPALAISMALVSVCALMLSLVEGGGVAAALLILAGIAYSLVNPATGVGVVTWFPPEWRSTMMSIKQAGVPMGGIMAAIIAGVVGPEDWRASAATVAVAALVTAVGAMLVPRGPAPPAFKRAGAAGILVVARNAKLLRICGATFLLNSAQAGFYTYLVLYLVGPVGLSAAMAALVFGTTHAASAVARIGWGLLADRVWRGDALGCLRVIAFAAGLGFVGLALGQALGLPMAAMAAVYLGVTVAAFAGVAQAAAVAEAPRHQIGAAMGVYMVLTPLGSVVGPSAFGGLIEATGGYWVPYLAMTGLTVLVGALVLRRG